MQATLGNLSVFLRGLGPFRLALLAGTGLATLGLLAFLTMRVSEPPMGLLYGELDARDAAQVVAALERARIPHRIGRGGTEILAPEGEIPRLRLMLARDGLPAGGNVGYEVFDRQGGLTATPFQQDINRLRALEGELARTIRGLAGVAAARVHLVLPRREPFSRERAEAQASIVLQMRGVQRLDREGVQAVMHLVASAVPGLKPQNIAIVDGRGELLARGGRALPEGGPGAGLPQEEMRRSQEARIARGVEEMLERALGPGRVRAEATLELNHERLQVTEERFDPDNQVARSQQSVNESNRNGEPPNVSVANQLPGAPPAAPSGPQSQEQRQEETTNYEIGRTTRTTVREEPVVKRISVAVLVDGVYEPAEAPGGPLRFRERTPEELARIATLVRGAIGYDEQRGDRVEVVSLRFGEATAELPVESASPGWLDLALTPALVTRLAESTLLALVALAALFLVGRPLVRRIAVQVVPAAMPAVAAGSGGGGEALSAPVASGTLAGPGTDEGMVSVSMVEGQIRASSLQKVGELADNHPDETLAVIRRWLAPEEPRR